MTRPDGSDPMAHEAFADALAACAVDALDDAAARAALEVHLASCPECRAELEALRRATTAIGLGLAPEAPPPDLRARTLARATAQPQSQAQVGAAAQVPAQTPARTPPRTPPSEAAGGSSLAPSRRAPTRLPWLVAAAAALLAVAASIYVVLLQREVGALRTLADLTTSRVESLRGELVDLRRQSAELAEIEAVIGAPDVRQAALGAAGASGEASVRAYWSPTQGLVLRARSMPALDAGRVYQLWMVPRAGTPVSAGLLTVQPDGSSSHVTHLPAMEAAAVAITVEPAGGSPGPTSAPVMVGNFN
ncbi:MAG: anti-sigma factor [Vicinamibacterales bacterium]